MTTIENANGLPNLGGYHPPPPATSDIGAHPATSDQVANLIDQLETACPDLNNNLNQAIAHLLAYTQHKAPKLLAEAIRFINREHTRNHK